MKKSLLVLIAAVSTAVSAQVTVYGKLNATVDSTKTGTTTVNSMINDTSHIGFRATEDLGRGLSARAVVETSVANHDPVGSADTQFGNRQSTVGLASKAGSVDIGRNVHSQFLAVINNDAFGTSYGSVAGDVHNLRGLRMSNGAFVTVTALPGITATYDRTHTATGTEAMAYSVATKVGGISATAARYEQGSNSSTLAAAQARVGKTAVYYVWSEDKGAGAKKGNLIGDSQQFGAVTAKASWGKTSTDVKAYAVGADYAFSKRTSASVAYRNVNTTSDIRQVGVGLTHLF